MPVKHFLFFIFLISTYVNAQDANDCNLSPVGWITDNQITTCTFSPPSINSQNIVSIEFGNNIDILSKKYHCYYLKSKVCNTNDCKECTVNDIYKLMISDKKFIAPTDETGPVMNCASTLVNIPFTVYNPVVTTVHAAEYAIINYTVYINRSGILTSTGHFLHPGRVQRKILKIGDEIFIITIGDGTGRFGGINKSEAPDTWRGVDKMLIDAFKCKQTQQTLFLFDVSGSMNDNSKWANAKKAATSTLDFLFDQSRKNNKTPSIGIMSYSGGCVDNPTTKLLNFSSDKSVISSAINNNLPGPNGGTPTPQAIKNAEAFLKEQLQRNNQCEGDLIILTDGQSSCGTIRPPGSFSQAQQQTIYTSCQTGSGTYQTRYQTIGFDIPPGSDAEKDLQYLSSTHGGRYYHAENSAELKKAFEKISRVFVPISVEQSTTVVSSTDHNKFALGTDLIRTKNYDSAFSIFKTFNSKYPNDSAGIYNYALMSEATDQYKIASKGYTSYLQRNPQVENKKDLEETIEKMNEYYRDYFNYQKEIVSKDAVFLNEHFKKLMNGQSIPLATEFTGFIKEKPTQYNKLADVLGTNDPQIISLCKEVVNSFKIAQRRVNSNAANWDQDAVPVISILYLKLEKLSLLVANLQSN